MESLQDAVDAEAERTGFSGVVRVDRSGVIELSSAYGLADRAHGVPNTVGAMFAIASGSKTMTAVAVMSLVERKAFKLERTARSLLGPDLPLIADDVTVEHLLAHRSGIGDYLDEDAVDDIGDYVMPVPVHELVRTLVCEPAGMDATAFLRSDELPGHAAVGYLSVDGARTNVFHLPVRGNGDGGIYTTAADLSAFWDALFAGRIVSPESLAQMVRPRSEVPEGSMRYGLGLYLSGAHDTVWLDGHDAGASMISLHRPSASLTCTVISNWSDGAWPVSELLDHRLGP